MAAVCRGGEHLLCQRETGGDSSLVDWLLVTSKPVAGVSKLRCWKYLVVNLFLNKRPYTALPCMKPQSWGSGFLSSSASGAGVSIHALELAVCCWQTGPLACIQSLHQQGLVCIASRRKLTPKAFPKWNAGGLVCSSHWIAVMIPNIMTSCRIASGRSLALFSLLAGHHPCFLCTLLLSAEVVVLVIQGEQGLCWGVYVLSLYWSRVQAECF